MGTSATTGSVMTQAMDKIIDTRNFLSLLQPKRRRLRSLSKTGICPNNGTCSVVEPCPKRRRYTTTTDIKKRIRFAEEDETFDVPKWNCIDKRNYWYHANDFQQFKKDNADTLVALSNVNGKVSAIDNDKYCVRGLEAQISILLLRIPFRRKSIQMVLSLQNIQNKMDQVDPQALREMSKHSSKADKLKAWRLAAMDVACQN